MSVNRIGGPPNMGQMFNNFDTNGDGSLSRSEMTKFAQGMPTRNGESTPSVDEMMTRLDTDGDGSISQSELEAGRPKGPPPPPPDGQGMPFAGGMDKSQLEAMAQRFSSASGQSVSADDLLSAFDTDGDGSVSGDEMRSMRQSMQSQLSAGMQAAMMRRR